ncbi:hypothetical protein [Rhodoferax sp. PAMC 29310]|uniref:hypothetical protein n=1 Tax=Rhodoferax sp. PAMC 29310 TaxID=2822760 RepID=UPI001B32B926|nr:hypothetical protein [Rhodoferax sp. PAMC 29310]
MVFFRALFFILLLGVIVCFGLFIYTGDARYKRYGLMTLKWIFFAGFGFFGVLILQKIL